MLGRAATSLERHSAGTLGESLGPSSGRSQQMRFAGTFNPKNIKFYVPFFALYWHSALLMLRSL